VLSDEQKRETYDRYGLEGLKEGRGGGGGFDGNDIFSMFFGGGGGSPFGGGGRSRGPRRGQGTFFAEFSLRNGVAQQSFA